jgi:hypothetical protein
VFQARFIRLRAASTAWSSAAILAHPVPAAPLGRTSTKLLQYWSSVLTKLSLAACPGAGGGATIRLRRSVKVPMPKKNAASARYVVNRPNAAVQLRSAFCWSRTYAATGSSFWLSDSDPPEVVGVLF